MAARDICIYVIGVGSGGGGGAGGRPPKFFKLGGPQHLLHCSIVDVVPHLCPLTGGGNHIFVV